MQDVRFVCVGKMREKHYIAAFDEYKKRLGAFCDFELIEIQEARLPERPSQKELEQALTAEAQAIARALPKNAYVVAMCVEGSQPSSEDFSSYVSNAGPSLCFIIGGSCGLHESVKREAALRLSMSKMTFPHHLARVMLMEQLYRAYMIGRGGKYHK